MAFAAFLAAAGQLAGNTIRFATGPVRLSGGPVDAQASFSLDPIHDTITISILNLVRSPLSAGQLISGITFTLSHFANTSATASIASESATMIEVDRMGRLVEVERAMDTDWRIASVPAGGFELCAVCREGGGPDQLLIGGPASSGGYTAANGSIAGNKAHNPFLQAWGDDAPVWTLFIPGIEDGTGVATAQLRFGTEYGGSVAGGYMVGETPEASSMALVGLGLIGLGIIARRLDIRRRS